MAKGDIWVAGIEEGPPRRIRLHAYSPAGTLASNIALNMQVDDDTGTDENRLGLLVYNGIIIVCSKDYFYTFVLSTSTQYSYRHSEDSSTYYWYSAYNNGKYSFLVGDSGSYSSRACVYYESADGINWSVIMPYEQLEGQMEPFCVLYDNYEGKYWVNGEDVTTAGNKNNFLLYWTVDFVTFNQIAGVSPYHDIAINGQDLWFENWPSAEATWPVISKARADGTVVSYSLSGTPANTQNKANSYSGEYGIVHANVAGVPFVILSEYNLSSVYVSSGLYVFNGVTFARTATLNESRYWDWLWPISSYRVPYGAGFVTYKSYDLLRQDSVAMSGTLISGFEVPDEPASVTQWQAFWLESGTEGEFWTEFDKTSEEQREYSGGIDFGA